MMVGRMGMMMGRNNTTTTARTSATATNATTASTSTNSSTFVRRTFRKRTIKSMHNIHTWWWGESSRWRWWKKCAARRTGARSAVPQSGRRCWRCHPCTSCPRTPANHFGKKATDIYISATAIDRLYIVVTVTVTVTSFACGPSRPCFDLKRAIYQHLN